jgi:hypothetical protein
MGEKRMNERSIHEAARIWCCCAGSALLLAPASARANEFDAMGDFFAWIGITMLYVALLLVVGLVCGVAGRRSARPARWKRPFAIGSLVSILVAAFAVCAVTIFLATSHGPLDEALYLAAGTAAVATPSALLAWRLLRRAGRNPTRDYPC